MKNLALRGKFKKILNSRVDYQFFNFTLSGHASRSKYPIFLFYYFGVGMCVPWSDMRRTTFYFVFNHNYYIKRCLKLFFLLDGICVRVVGGWHTGMVLHWINGNELKTNDESEKYDFKHTCGNKSVIRDRGEYEKIKNYRGLWGVKGL